MKKAYLSIIILLALLTSCERPTGAPVGEATIIKQEVKPVFTTAYVQGEFVSVPTIGEVNIWLSKKADMSDPSCTKLRVTGNTFAGNINNLQEGKTYYYQYELITKHENEKFKSKVFSFSIAATIPTVKISSVKDITSSSVLVYLKITNDGGASITESGICYSIAPDPTIASAKQKATSNNSVLITNLEEQTEYYLRAYAKNAKGIAYSAPFCIQTLIAPQTGALKGVFSISETEKVYFSQGNLQYDIANDTWLFADNQWDMIGMGYGLTDDSLNCVVGGTVPNSDNRNVLDNTYTGMIDLFAWGTGDNPTFRGLEDEVDLNHFVDWGDNPIQNGGNKSRKWRTLTRDEWYYMFITRSNAFSKLAAACVNGLNGVVVLPDNWTLPEGCTFKSGFSPNPGGKYFKSINNYTLEQWTAMEAAGAVFLPAAGGHWGRAAVWDVGTNGFYQFAPPATRESCCICISANGVSEGAMDNIADGRSVRLVQNAN